MNFNRLCKEFNIQIFLKKIKVFPIKLELVSKPRNNKTSPIYMENLIGDACGFEKDRHIKYGQYETKNEPIVKPAQYPFLYDTDILRDGSIFSKLDKSFKFSPIITFIGNVHGLNPYQLLVGCLYSTKNNMSYITFFEDNSDYLNFYFIKKTSGNLMNKIPKIKSFLKQLIKKKTILYGLEGDLKFILMNRDLNFKNNELSTFFSYAKNERKKLLSYLQKDGLASNIIKKQKINYNLSFYTINKNKNFFFTYEQIFEKDENYIKSKLKKPSFELKID